MAYCFASQAVYPPALEALQKESGHGSAATDDLGRRLVHTTFGITLAGYLGVGVGGAVHGPHVPPANILDGCYPHFYIYGAYGALICCLSLAFPVMLIVARMHFLSLAETPLLVMAKASRAYLRPVVTLVLILVALTIAILIPKVDVLLSLMGGTCGVALSWVIPALLYQRHVSHEAGTVGGHVLTYVLLAFGLLVCLATTPLQIYDLLNPPLPKSPLHAGGGRVSRQGGRSHRISLLDDLPVHAATRRSYSAMLGPSRPEVRWLLNVADGDRESRSADRGKRARLSRDRERRQASVGHPPDHARGTGSPSLRALRAWRDYLPRAVVVGLDVDAAVVVAAANESRIAAHTVDSTDGAAIAQLNLSFDVDVVIDSTRRVWSAQQQALLLLWPHLRPTGLYCIEHLTSDASSLLHEAERRYQ
eukprot:CAMPEP_0183370658 /NCGR_PEP_ID=MMETSP0164_2-20130417/103098_1 /TAXON_ID=221442 /ORGANISM="Coccolithus pelagicus ssp braarudi, Strain PLY182g" /LENGTH=419 /DNA_ID=CAMNT_0025547105 /DNA_START=8 /DNA_END=1264 /DNA_ORIENTATION=+